MGGTRASHRRDSNPPSVVVKNHNFQSLTSVSLNLNEPELLQLPRRPPLCLPRHPQRGLTRQRDGVGLSLVGFQEDRVGELVGVHAPGASQRRDPASRQLHPESPERFAPLLFLNSRHRDGFNFDPPPLPHYVAHVMPSSPYVRPAPSQLSSVWHQLLPRRA